MKNKIILVVSVLLPIAFSGCQSDKDSTISNADTVGTFIAKYYLEDDGTSPGVGNDGSDPTIIPALIASETVKQPSINYSYSDFYSIDSYNFYAVWEGPIDSVGEAQTINANFKVSWSDVTLYVDGVLNSQWSNSNKIIPLTLSAGSHNVRIEYHNHWHTTDFNVSFTSYPTSTVAQAPVLLAPIVDDSSDIIYIGAYESGSIYNQSKVILPDSPESLLIVLTSYNAINWLIDNPYNTIIDGIVFKSYAPGSTITESSGAPIYEVTDLNYGYNSFDAPRADINTMTGRYPDYEFGEYSLLETTVPAF